MTSATNTPTSYSVREPYLPAHGPHRLVADRVRRGPDRDMGLVIVGAVLLVVGLIGLARRTRVG
jgi:hypothetical protein